MKRHLFLLLLACSNLLQAQTPSIAEYSRAGADPHLMSGDDALGLPPQSFVKAVLLNENTILVNRHGMSDAPLDTVFIPREVPLERVALDSLLHERYGGFHPLLNDSPLLQGFSWLSELSWYWALALVILSLLARRKWF